jgi:tight adherence protein B
VSVDVAVLIASTVAGIAAVVVIVAPQRTPTATDHEIDAGTAGRFVAASIVAGLVLAFSGWFVAASIVGLGCWFAVGKWQQRDRGGVGDVERTDALASWIENLRDVLVAGEQPVGAITATVATCPTAIRPQVRRLAAGLGRQEPEVVFRRFADDLDDPLGDLVAAGLLVAVQRGARTTAVLGSLAEQARRQADRRRLVDAERAPIQREVTILTLVMGSLIVVLLVLGRTDYLAAYDTAGGQAFLGVVLGIYALLLVRVQRLARFPRPSRFLTNADITSRRAA